MSPSHEKNTEYVFEVTFQMLTLIKLEAVNFAEDALHLVNITIPSVFTFECIVSQLNK